MFQAQSVFQPHVCGWATPPETSVFLCIMEVEGWTLSSLTFSGAAPPTDRGCNGAPAQHYLAGGARESGGARGWVCSVSGNGRSTQGPGEAALRAAVSEGLAPGSWGHRGTLSASSGANFLFGRENRKTLAGNGLLPAVPFLGLGMWGEASWLCVPQPILLPGNPRGDMGLFAMTANPTSPESLV